MHARIVRMKGYVAAQVTGTANLDAMLRMIKSLGALTSARGDNLLLVNLLQVEGELNFTGQFMIGEYVVQHLSHIQRLASVVPADKITRTSEKVARAQGVQLSVFHSEAAAVAWLLGSEADARPAGAGRAPMMDAVREVFWEAYRYLFPAQAQAIQMPNGNLVISWPMANDPNALFEMSTPITIRFEPELLDDMHKANEEQRKRIVGQQEGAFRAGLVGYDPYAKIPKARVIVLG